MLSFQILKNHAGLLLLGDYETLRSLHGAIHDVNEASILLRDKEDSSLIGLAYDVRKAYEKQREILPAPEHYPEVGPRFGVKILWPVLLWQSRLYRAALGFMDSTKLQQAYAYLLEAVIEAGLREDFGNDAGEAITQEWAHLDASHPDAAHALDSRAAVFCSWTKATRKRNLAGLLASFSPMYPVLRSLNARSDLAALPLPEDFEKWNGVEWPDPKW